MHRIVGGVAKLSERPGVIQAEREAPEQAGRHVKPCGRGVVRAPPGCAAPVLRSPRPRPISRNRSPRLLLQRRPGKVGRPGQTQHAERVARMTI